MNLDAVEEEDEEDKMEGNGRERGREEISPSGRRKDQMAQGRRVHGERQANGRSRKGFEAGDRWSRGTCAVSWGVFMQ